MGAESKQKHLMEQMAEALDGADRQMRQAADCLEKGLYDEALLHLNSMSRVRTEALTRFHARALTEAQIADADEVLIRMKYANSLGRPIDLLTKLADILQYGRE